LNSTLHDAEEFTSTGVNSVPHDRHGWAEASVHGIKEKAVTEAARAFTSNARPLSARQVCKADRHAAANLTIAGLINIVELPGRWAICETSAQFASMTSILLRKCATTQTFVQATFRHALGLIDATTLRYSILGFDLVA